MNIYLLGLLWVVGSVVAAALLMILIRRFISDERRDAADEAAGRIFTVVAGLQAVLVAFVLISLFDAASTARDSSYQEANSVVAIYWDADLLPDPMRTEVKNLSRSYAETVVNEEWPRMAVGGLVGDAGKAELDQLHQAIVAVQAGDNVNLAQQQSDLQNQLSSVYQARQARLDAAAQQTNPILWYALILGAVLSVGLTCLFGGPRLSTHIIVAATLAGTLTILLFATYQLQNPFGGGAHVGPDAFDAALSQLA